MFWVKVGYQIDIHLKALLSKHKFEKHTCQSYCNNQRRMTSDQILKNLPRKGIFPSAGIISTI